MEGDAGASVAVRGERQAAVSDRETRRACSLQEQIRTGRLDPGDVASGRAYAPPPVASFELLVAQVDPGAFGCHAEQSSEASVCRVEAEGEASLHVRWDRRSGSGIRGRSLVASTSRMPVTLQSRPAH